MNKDLFGLLIALAGLFIVWLWATGRITNAYNAVVGTPAAQGGSNPSSEQSTSAGTQTTAPTGQTPAPGGASANWSSLLVPDTATGQMYQTTAAALAELGQMQVPINLPGIQTSLTQVNNAPSEMSLLPPQYVDPFAVQYGSINNGGLLSLLGIGGSGSGSGGAVGGGAGAPTAPSIYGPGVLG